MNKHTYSDIKKRIRCNINLNGYELDDLLHDTIIKLYNKGYTHETELKRLCVIVAKNIVRDKYRKEKNIIHCQLSNEITHEEKRTIKEYVLPVRYEELFILKYKLGLSMQDIAETTCKKYSTIRVHHMKMKQEFKELNNL